MWLDDYLDYSKNNECPPLYHLWTGLTIAGAVLKNSVWMQHGNQRLYPNLWTFLVGPSGCGKTTACEYGFNIMSKLTGVKMVSDAIDTPKKMVVALAKKIEDSFIPPSGAALIYAPEMSTLLNKGQASREMISFLLRMADCPKVWSDDIYHMVNVALSVLTASAVTGLRDLVPAGALSTGFMARFIIVSGEDRKEDKIVYSFPFVDKKAEMEVWTKILFLSKAKGEIKLGRAAFDWYHQWYLWYKRETCSDTGSRINAWHQRKPIHLLKVATILSVCDNDRNLEMSVRALEVAAAMLDELEPGIIKTYASFDGEAAMARQERAGGLAARADKAREIRLARVDTKKQKAKKDV